MFYSHTFLARKGPLGTVWCAAHLQHKLKRSHYTSTDITSTVERIMFPEVPIALRMSGHLLLGVVRIYSKKVDYLYQDFNVFLISLRKAFSSVEPEDETLVPFESVTLSVPDTFHLDAVDLDYDFCYEGKQDKNLKSFEDITLSFDTIATGRDPYIAINYDEDLLRRSSNLDNASVLGHGLMEEENAPPETMNHPAGSTNPSPEPIDVNILETIPEVEGLRENATVWQDPLNDVIPPDTYMEQQIYNEKEPLTSVVEEIPFATEVPILHQHNQMPINSPGSDRIADVLFSNNSLGHESLNLELGPSPPVHKPKGGPLVDKPKPKPRKRKQRYDEATVLTNRVMKAALDNCNDIKRKRKCCPSTDLDVWRYNNRLRKENIFSEPLITGLAKNLRDLYSSNIISSKPHLKEAGGEPSFAQFSPLYEPRFCPAPQLPEPANIHHDEMEILRNYEGSVDYNIVPDGINDHIFNSPIDGQNFTPATASSIGSTQMGTTRDMSSSGTVGSEIGSPYTIVEYPGFGNIGLSTIPEDMGAAEADDLNFLASEDYTPTNFRTDGFSSLSGTTRKVAQYLKEKYSPISEDLDADLSMNQLLEGKTRKVCARMFFETMVLKSGGFVDVQQEEAYGDIKLKLTTELFKD